jgi:perosamine synthetase
MPWATSVYWMYSILINDAFGLPRDDLMMHLKDRRIDSRPFFHPLHTLPPYDQGLHLAVAEDLAARGINLPSAVTLTEDDICRVCMAVRELAEAVPALKLSVTIDQDVRQS